MSKVAQNTNKQPKAPKEFVSFSSPRAISAVSAELLRTRAHLDPSPWIIRYSAERLHKNAFPENFIWKDKGRGCAENGKEGIDLRKHSHLKIKQQQKKSTFLFQYLLFFVVQCLTHAKWKWQFHQVLKSIEVSFQISISFTDNFRIHGTMKGDFFANRIESKCWNLHKMRFPFST